MIELFLSPVFENALSKIGIEIHEGQLFFERPKNAEHGDFATTIAMMLAKQEKKNPRTIAEQILANLPVSEYIESVEIAGAGFLNIRCTPKLFQVALGSILEKGSSFGRITKGKGLKANVEYVSANPTGPLHPGHGRNIALGDTIASLLDWYGYDVTREYYFNNAGNQMNMLAKSIHARYCQLFDAEYPFPENGYNGLYIGELASTLQQQFGEAYKEENEQSLAICKQVGEEWAFAAIKKTLKTMNVHHDVYFNEDSLYTSGAIEKVIADLKERDFAYEQDGAVWFKSTLFGADKDRVIVKSSGEPTYRLPDIAYHINKLERGFDVVVDIFGADHIATVPDVISGVKALGFDSDKINAVIYQMVVFVRDGKLFKPSKRKGDAYTLDDLIEDTSADIVRYFFLMRSTNTQLEFDLSLAAEQSEKNPLFYLQYAHARICSLFEKVSQEGIDITPNADISVLKEVAELELIKTLMRFPTIIEKASEQTEPQILCEYLRDVANGFHAFYHNCRIMGVENSLTQARLVLANATRSVLKNGFTILGVAAPERM